MKNNNNQIYSQIVSNLDPEIRKKLTDLNYI